MCQTSNRKRKNQEKQANQCVMLTMHYILPTYKTLLLKKHDSRA